MGKKFKLESEFVPNMESVKDTLPVRVIFLDVDGVLNNEKSLRMGELISMDCVRHVRRISRLADADIVISSSWRIGNSTHTLREMFHMVGLFRVIGRTSSNDSSLSDRGDEIKQWLDANPTVEKYVILDDDRDILPEQMPYFINTDAMEGITENQSTYAIRNIFGVTTPFCTKCNGYNHISEEQCTECKRYAVE